MLLVVAGGPVPSAAQEEIETTYEVIAEAPVVKDNFVKARKKAVKLALKTALEKAPLQIIALGPLTNIALVLHHFPEVVPNIQGITAIAGQRYDKNHILVILVNGLRQFFLHLSFKIQLLFNILKKLM